MTSPLPSVGAGLLSPGTRAALGAAVALAFNPEAALARQLEEQASRHLLVAMGPGHVNKVAGELKRRREDLGMSKLDALRSVTADITSGRWQG